MEMSLFTQRNESLHPLIKSSWRGAKGRSTVFTCSQFS